ncbi:MAG: LPS export ABC transporter permease LptF [Desulfuromonadales bacterium]|nr:LPS export ABC transporter permease LptF [Desulfuromonadales bacterium]
MFSSRVHRYIIREILSPTLLCLLIFTMVLLMGRMVKLVDLIINKGVSFLDILALFATLLPSLLSISLPLAFLMGIMIGLGRMSADSETVALKSAGLSLGKISVPVFALALIFALLTGWAGLWAKPWGYRAFKAKTFEITRQKATIGFQPRVFMDQFSNLVLYANDINARAGLMQDLFIVEKKDETTSWVFADSGVIVADEQSETVTLQLQDGVIHRQQNDAADSYQMIHFSSYNVQPNITGTRETAKQPRRRPKEMPTSQLWSGIATQDKPSRANALRSELHQRLCSPLAPLLFALFGLPFSIQSHRSGRSGGFIMGLVIYLCYYALLSAADTLTAEAAVSPLLSFWGVHGLLLLAGAWLLRQSSLERPNLLAIWVDQALDKFKKKDDDDANS